MSSMTTEVKAAASVIPMVVTEPVKEPEMFQRTRSEFNRWLQTQFDNHYHTMRNGGYRSFLARNHPAELERYDAACEAMRREEFTRFAELQTLGLYLHLQVQQKEAYFRRVRNRLLAAMAVTGVVLYGYFHPEQALQAGHELLALPGKLAALAGRLLN
ncbi:hypothetical protein [Salmonella enterica]|nr:hypothetical protein [Salmonella enterica]OHF64216.1 hypothetical protein A7S96_14630 [Salmonella enterica subsp. diarizonae serovar 60:r:e,n,x,z15]OHF67056.1 hypothetical protein A7T04_14615 [Salmonella enterica subsp. diarizonae serovar 60:r:e,n,x,z15]OHF72678.1 hypothetical protein A7T09_14635 [Salmonella enterica subsp. diarizonae serovar 60:r:e,n,x,z15]OHF77420.1 hypothetical protein A7T26_14635 [Salmonella enterica subsp. diarizonae serovar 60:r:e,n,x,z15]OHF83273.1 hypothetical prote